MHLDFLVLIVGAMVVAAVLTAAVVITAWRVASRGDQQGAARQSATVSALARLRAPVTAVTGASLALERGQGRRALPTRPAILGAVVGVLGIIGAFTLAAGIGDAVEHAERFGAVWDLEVNFLADEPNEAFLGKAGELAADPETVAVSRVARAQLPVGDVVLPLYALDAVKGAIDFVVLDGERPEHPGDIVLGPDSARTLGVGIGDALTLGDNERFRVSGIALLPTTAHSSFDQGAWVLAEDVIRAAPDALGTTADDGGGQPLDHAAKTSLVFDFGFVAARYNPGVDIDAAVERISGSDAEGLYIERPLPPADQQNLRNVRPLPLLFGGFATILAMGALAHIAVSVLRRRRADLAVLRALGCTPFQIRACLAWQAITLTAIGVVVGVPLGIALGRAAWKAVADATPMVYVEPFAALALLLVVPVAFVLANVVAAWPGHRAARMALAEVLHTE